MYVCPCGQSIGSADENSTDAGVSRLREGEAMKRKITSPDQAALFEHLVAIFGRLTDDYDCSVQGSGWSMSVTLWDRATGREVWACAEEPRVIAERFADWVANRDKHPDP